MKEGGGLREIRSLTAIRGIAALWVVTHHFRPHLECVSPALGSIFNGYMGYTGVDIFFVLSGFILTLVYADLTRSGLKDFALRRVMRIYPLHLTVLAVMAATAFIPGFWPGYLIDWHDLPAQVLLLQPYLGRSLFEWNSPSWSAGVELFCYLLFPAALLLLRRLPLAALLLLVVLAGCAEWQVQTCYAGIWGGWGSVARGLAGFGLGMAVQLAALRWRAPRRGVIAVEVLAAVTLVAAALGRDAQVIPLAAAGLIWALAYEAGPVARVLRGRIPVYLGEISFSIYMIHQPLIAAYAWAWPNDWGSPMFLVRKAGYFVLLIALASLTYRLIERPARRLWRVEKAVGGVGVAPGLRLT
jgi:peptidoglycan/LPS O-acetylase OafA/YrhL